jgi:parvulin-like peptidyl-prolyl isomerase
MRARGWTLTAACVAALALLPGPAPAQAPATSAKPAAVVNGEAITLAEVDAIVNGGGPSAVQLTTGKLRELRLDAVNMLIDEMLLTQFLRRNGPRVDSAEVNKLVADLADSQKKKGKTLQDYFKENDQTDAQLRAEITAKLQWRDYVKARIGEADLTRSYEENREFFDGVQVRASHIVLLVPTDAGEPERQQAREKLLALRQEIVSGKLDFAEAAKKHSQCISAPAGGDLGWFLRKGQFDEAFARAAFALPVGQVSDVVQTEAGLHLIKVTDRKPGQPSDFNKVKEDVRRFCQGELQDSILVQMRKNAHVEISLP